MQLVHCTVGGWKAQARVQEIDKDKVMATIQVLDRDDSASVASCHTVVFDHEEGCDTMEETKTMMQRLLGRRYGG